MEHDVKTPADESPKAANDQEDADPEAYPGHEVRQGEIILNTPLRKRLFFGGLIVIPILMIIIAGISIANS